MIQSLHIMQKDVRYLWRELALLAVLVVLFGWKEFVWTEPLLELTAIYLIARVFHAETIPGDTQFWITRPYSWKSLLAAKMLFVLVFINMPLVIARIALLDRQGFPIVSNLPALLWSQLLIILAVCLPIAALASLTADTLPFILSMLTLTVVGFAAEAATVSVFESRVVPYLNAIGDALRIRSSIPPVSAAAWPIGVRWVRGAAVLSMLCALSLWIIYRQYKSRRTHQSRVMAMGLLALTLFVLWLIPVSFAMSIHTRFSRAPVEPSALRIGVGDKPQKSAMGRPGQIQISLPLNVEGIPGDLEAEADGLALTLESADGRLSQNFVSPSRAAPNAGARGFDAVFFIDPLFFNSARQLGTKLHGTIYLTVFGNPKSQSIVLSTHPVDAGAGLQCFRNPITSQMECRSPFRWPSALVYARVRDSTESIWPMISYSPFPAGMELNVVEQHWTSGPPPSDPKATIIVKETLGHLQRDFDVQDFRLQDFAVLGGVTRR